MTDWSSINPGTVTGFGTGYTDGGSGGVTSGVESSVVTRSAGHAPLYSPDNPLFWFAALLLVTVGLVQVSTKVKAGPFHGSASV